MSGCESSPSSLSQAPIPLVVTDLDASSDAGDERGETGSVSPNQQAIPLLANMVTSNSRCTTPMSAISSPVMSQGGDMPGIVDDQRSCSQDDEDEIDEGADSVLKDQEEENDEDDDEESMLTGMNLTVDKAVQNPNLTEPSIMPKLSQSLRRPSSNNYQKQLLHHREQQAKQMMMMNQMVMIAAMQQQQSNLAAQMNGSLDLSLLRPSSSNQKMNRQSLMPQQNHSMDLSTTSSLFNNSSYHSSNQQAHSSHHNSSSNNRRNRPSNSIPSKPIRPNTTSQLNPSQSILESSLTNSPEFTQLLLEYRQVLLDVLTKSILATNQNNGNADETLDGSHKSVVLPVKCQCGYTSELSKQITRASTYVHQLELKFWPLFESAVKSSDPNRNGPKRPWFINSQSQSASQHDSATVTSPKVSLLEKSSTSSSKKSMNRMSATDKQSLMQQLQQQPLISLFSGNSSMNSSVNGDEELGAVSDEDEDEDDVNDKNQIHNLSNQTQIGNSNHMYSNGIGNNSSLEEMLLANVGASNVSGKTILEGYLESMKHASLAVPKNEITSEINDNHQNDHHRKANDMNADTSANGEEDFHRGPGKRIDLNTKRMVVRLQRQGSSFTDISRQIGISRKSVRRIISNYRQFGFLDKKREPQKSNVNGNSSLQSLMMVPSIATLNGVDDENDRDMIPDDNRQHSEVSADGEMDDDDNDDNDQPLAQEFMEQSNLMNQFPMNHKTIQYNQQHNKAKRNISLIHHGSYNNNNTSNGSYSQMLRHQQQQQNGGSNLNNRLSLIKPSQSHDRYKAHDLRIRHNGNNESLQSIAQSQSLPLHQRISKSYPPIVPPLPSSTSMYPVVQQQSSLSRSHQSSNRFYNNESVLQQPPNRHKNRMNRYPSDTSMSPSPFKDSLLMSEMADKNNNTQLNNCNMNVNSASSASSTSSKGEAVTNGSNLPSLPINDPGSDSEANLVPKSFVDGFPSGIMNSLNPNRATKLTLEDFNIVWQLRSKHWTHNQIRKYFQQRGKSISKSSISRIMNGKQRNFQQFFNVVPSGSNY